jgi:hypothetical protein
MWQQRTGYVAAKNRVCGNKEQGMWQGLLRKVEQVRRRGKYYLGEKDL